MITVLLYRAVSLNAECYVLCVRQRANSEMRTAFKSEKGNERDSLEDLGVDKSVHMSTGFECVKRKKRPGSLLRVLMTFRDS